MCMYEKERESVMGVVLDGCMIICHYRDIKYFAAAELKKKADVRGRRKLISYSINMFIS